MLQGRHTAGQQQEAAGTQGPAQHRAAIKAATDKKHSSFLSRLGLDHKKKTSSSLDRATKMQS